MNTKRGFDNEVSGLTSQEHVHIVDELKKIAGSGSAAYRLLLFEGLKIASRDGIGDFRDRGELEAPARARTHVSDEMNGEILEWVVRTGQAKYSVISQLVRLAVQERLKLVTTN